MDDVHSWLNILGAYAPGSPLIICGTNKVCCCFCWSLLLFLLGFVVVFVGVCCCFCWSLLLFLLGFVVVAVVGGTFYLLIFFFILFPHFILYFFLFILLIPLSFNRRIECVLPVM